MMRMSVVGGVRGVCSLPYLATSPPRLPSVLALPNHNGAGARPGLLRTKHMVARVGNDEPSGAEVDVSIFRFSLGKQQQQQQLA
jgi:hypothetical protein